MKIPASMRSWMGLFLLGGGLVHAAIVISIVRQPLDVARHPGDRSLVWGLYHNSIHRIGPGADFFAVYHAGIAASQGLSPYTPDEDPRLTPYFFPFRYLPIVGSTVGRAFARFPPLTAYRIWILVCEGVLGLLIWGLWRRWERLSRVGLRGGPPPAGVASPEVPLRQVTLGRAVTTGLLLLSTPYFLELHMGQFTFVMAAFCALALLWTETAEEGESAGPGWKRFAAGALLAAATVLKTVPIVILPAVWQRRSLLIAGVIGVVAITVFSFPFFANHPGQWERFRELNFGSPRPAMAGGNYSVLFLNLLIGKTLGSLPDPEQFDRLAAIFRVAVLSATAVLVLLSRSRSVEIKASALLLAHFVSYGHVWEHHLSAVVVIGCLMLLHIVALGGESAGLSERMRRMLGMLGALVVTSLVLLALPTPWPLLDQARDPTVFDPSQQWPTLVMVGVTATKVLPTLVLYGVACLVLSARGMSRRLG